MRKEERQEIQNYLNDGSWIASRIVWKMVGLVVLIGFLGFGIKMLFVPAGVVSKIVNPDSIVSNYEEFQNIHNACKKIDTDMGMIHSLPDNDKMFEHFSKNAMLATKMQQLTRWIEEYNAKSKMITRGYWKSPSLPYQLSINDFQNYGGDR